MMPVMVPGRWRASGRRPLLRERVGRKTRGDRPRGSFLSLDGRRRSRWRALTRLRTRGHEPQRSN
jgi:hypothetical protein